MSDEEVIENLEFLMAMEVLESEEDWAVIDVGEKTTTEEDESE